MSEASPENLASGLEELEAQQSRMTDATTKLLSVVSEAGGGPWVNGPGLTEYSLSKWLGVQEDRGDSLRDIVIRKQEVLARLVEVEEDDSLDSLGVDQGAGQAHHPFELSVSVNQSQDTREQASRDQEQRAPGQGRVEDGNKFPREAPLQARQPGNRERGWEQAVPGYIRRFPVLMRGRTKLEDERSGLDEVVKEVV